jgi:hypothetical protein
MDKMALAIGVCHCPLCKRGAKFAEPEAREAVDRLAEGNQDVGARDAGARDGRSLKTRWLQE